jgi:outer membrane lipoprotein-sorting protein
MEMFHAARSARARPHARGRHRARHLGTAVAALAVAGLLLGACSTASSSGGPAGTNGSGAAAGVSAELAAIAAKVQSGKGATFKATYKSTGTNSSGTIVFAQKPPKSSFSSGSTQLIDNGSTTYICTAESATTTCLASSGSTNPLAGVLGLFNGATITTFLQTARAQAAAHAAGYTLSYSTASYAGQPSKCVTAKGPSGASKYCVTDSGIVAYVSTPDGNVFELTDYSTDVPDAQFQLPAGATTQTLPPGVSIP